jgi:protein-disulfide isomerase
MRRIVPLALAAAAALFAPAFAQDALSPEQRRDVDARIRSYILENPEVLLEALDVLEQRRQQAQASADAELIAAQSAALFQDGHSHVFGNPDGDLTIVEFSDYRCGYCKRAHPEVQRLLESDGGIALVMKEFPILGPDSTLAARAAMAALREAPDLYPAFHEAMMEHKGQLDESAVFGIARSVGLEEASLRLSMEDPAIAQAIAANYDLAKALRIEGTPAFVIGDQVLRGFAPYDAMVEIVAQARQAAN